MQKKCVNINQICVDWLLFTHIFTEFMSNSFLILGIFLITILNKDSPLLIVFKKKILKYFDLFLKKYFVGKSRG